MGILDRWRTQSNPEPQAEESAQSHSGRGHTSGFLDYEELNSELRHPSGLRVFDQMYRTDGDVRQIVMLVSNPIISGTWEMVPYGGDEASDRDQEVAKLAKQALFEWMRPNLPGHLAQFLPVLIRSGFAPGEKIWGVTEVGGSKLLFPKTVGLRLPRTINRWFQDRNGELTGIEQFRQSMSHVVTETLPRNGEAVYGAGKGTDSFRDMSAYVTLERDHLVYYRVGAEGDNWEGVSMLRPAYKHWKIKDAIEKIDAIAQEREAIGIPILYPPTGATPSQLDAWETMLGNLRVNEQGFIIAPGPHAQDLQDGNGGWRLDLLGFNRQGQGRDPGPSLDYHTGKIAASFISEFMRLGHSNVGARATAQVQANPFLDSVEALAGIVEDVLNEDLVVPFTAYNFNDVEGPPRLQMSLVDSTALTQLADFISKLVMVGAMMPDQQLENFLRDRADLPQPDPDAIQARKSLAKRNEATKAKTDDEGDVESRKEVVTGPATEGFGANAPPGLPHGNKPGPARDRSADSSKGLDRDDGDAVVLYEPPEDAIPIRPRKRPLRGAEVHIDLDAIEDRVSEMPDRFRAAIGDDLLRIARIEYYSKSKRKKVPVEVRDRLRDEFEDIYTFGRQTVRDEVSRQVAEQTFESMLPMTLEQGKSRAHMDEVADFMLEVILDGMEHAARGRRLAGADEASAQVAAEEAARVHLRQQSHGHGMRAFNLGRHDQAEEIHLAADTPQLGARYNSLLDNDSCDPCYHADDDTVRELDDPVRIQRQPPNPACHSTASGRNMCRCFETYEVMV